MGRIIALLIGFMTLIFTIMINAIANFTGGPTFNPFKGVTNFISGSLNSADRMAPGVANALDFERLRRRGVRNLDLIDQETPPRQVLTGADLAGVNAAAGIYAGAEVSDARFLGALLDEATFEGAQGARPNFRKARMTLARLTAVHFVAPNFSEADLRGANARAGRFLHGDFSGADLTGARFSGALMTGGAFPGVHAAHVRFVEAKLTQATFNDADLRLAKFLSADLTNATFDGADVTGADFRASRISGVDFSNAKGLEEARFDGACGDSLTVLPIEITLAECALTARR